MDTIKQHSCSKSVSTDKVSAGKVLKQLQLVMAHMEEYWLTVQHRCAGIVSALIIMLWRWRDVCSAYVFLKQVQSVVQKPAFMIVTASQLYVFWFPRDRDPQNVMLSWIQKLFTGYCIQVSIKMQMNWLNVFPLLSCFIHTHFNTGRNYTLYVWTKIQTYANAGQSLSAEAGKCI